MSCPKNTFDFSDDIHIPVLVSEVLEFLIENPNGTYLDATVGGGGHASKILSRLGPQGRLIGLDPDSDQIDRSFRRLGADSRFTLVKGWANQCESILGEKNLLPLDGVLVDFGLSQAQLADRTRGFSFQNPESPLDMRFDKSAGLTAELIVNESTEEELETIFRDGGMVRGVQGTIRRILAMRPLETVGDLVQAAGARRSRIHPATLLFQAVRIKVNKELARISEFMDVAPKILASGGRAVFMAYHSLEDRIIKRSLASPDSLLKRNFRKPLRASRDEIKANPASRSVRLRVATRSPA